ncbi:MAG: hypothetical protein M1128_02650 [Candidatus Marsarchaeota archaeon]|nr:hypothetical protein [Candidatus Marsarchaeota archaeon]
MPNRRIGMLLAMVLLAALPAGAIAGSAISSSSVTNSLQNSYCIITQSYNTPIGACIMSALPIALIGILLSMMLIAVSYMLGEVFNISNLKGWYKGELWEVAKSVAIIVIIFAVLVIMSGIAATLYGLPYSTSLTGNQVSASGIVLNNLVGVYTATMNDYIVPQYSVVNGALNGMIGLSLAVGALKSFTYSLYFPIPIPFAGSLDFGSTGSIYKSSVIESLAAAPNLSFVVDIISLIIIPIEILFSLLSAYFIDIAAIGLSVFLPIGIVLRAIPFLRGIGGTMIGIGIMISLIFPSLLLLFNIPVSSLMVGPTPTAQPAYSCSSSNYVYCLIMNFISTTTNTILGAIKNMGYSLTGAYYGLATFFSSPPSIFPALNYITGEVEQVILQFILLILDIIITITIGNSIAKMLGGKVRLGIGKFKVA